MALNSLKLIMMLVLLGAMGKAQASVEELSIADQLAKAKAGRDTAAQLAVKAKVEKQQMQKLLEQKQTAHAEKLAAEQARVEVVELQLLETKQQLVWAAVGAAEKALLKARASEDAAAVVAADLEQALAERELELKQAKHELHKTEARKSKAKQLDVGAMADTRELQSSLHKMQQELDRVKAARDTAGQLAVEAKANREELAPVLQKQQAESAEKLAAEQARVHESDGQVKMANDEKEKATVPRAELEAALQKQQARSTRKRVSRVQTGTDPRRHK